LSTFKSIPFEENAVNALNLVTKNVAKKYKGGIMVEKTVRKTRLFSCEIDLLWPKANPKPKPPKNERFVDK